MMTQMVCDCGKLFEVPTQTVGTWVECPHCGRAQRFWPGIAVAPRTQGSTLPPVAIAKFSRSILVPASPNYVPWIAGGILAFLALVLLISLILFLVPNRDENPPLPFLAVNKEAIPKAEANNEQAAQEKEEKKNDPLPPWPRDEECRQALEKFFNDQEALGKLLQDPAAKKGLEKLLKDAVGQEAGEKLVKDLAGQDAREKLPRAAIVREIVEKLQEAGGQEGLEKLFNDIGLPPLQKEIQIPGPGNGRNNPLPLKKVWRGHDGVIRALAFSPDGSRVLSGSGGFPKNKGGKIVPADNTLRLWQFPTGAQIKRQGGFKDFLSAAAFSPDGRFGVFSFSGEWKTPEEYVRGTDYSVHLWDLKEDRELFAANKPGPGRFQGHTNEVFTAAFSPTGRRLVSGGMDTTIRVWDTQSGKELRSFRHDNSVYRVVFLPDSRYLLSASADYSVRLWDIETGVQMRRFVGHTDIVWSVAVSADGRYALSGAGLQPDPLPKPNGVHGFIPGTRDFTVRLWEVATGKEIRRFTGHTDGVHDVAFTPDGRHIVSGSLDSTVRLWERDTGREIKCFVGHDQGVTSLAVAPNGRCVLTGGFDATIRCWELP